MEEKPTEPEIPPRTGVMKDLRFSGSVDLNSTIDGKVSGVNIYFCTLDYRVLGTAVSQDGKYVMETSIDMADFSDTGDVYYLFATYVAPDGSKYSNIGIDKINMKSQISNLYQAYAAGWHLNLHNDPIRVNLDF